MSMKCKHSVLIRLDGKNKPVAKNTPASQITPHFQCEDCGDIYYAMVTDKPLLVSQVVRS